MKAVKMCQGAGAWNAFSLPDAAIGAKTVLVRELRDDSRLALRGYGSVVPGRLRPFAEFGNVFPLQSAVSDRATLFLSNLKLSECGPRSSSQTLSPFPLFWQKHPP